MKTERQVGVYGKSLGGVELYTSKKEVFPSLKYARDKTVNRLNGRLARAVIETEAAIGGLLVSTSHFEGGHDLKLFTGMMLASFVSVIVGADGIRNVAKFSEACKQDDAINKRIKDKLFNEYPAEPFIESLKSYQNSGLEEAIENLETNLKPFPYLRHNVNGVIGDYQNDVAYVATEVKLRWYDRNKTKFSFRKTSVKINPDGTLFFGERLSRGRSVVTRADWQKDPSVVSRSLIKLLSHALSYN